MMLAVGMMVSVCVGAQEAMAYKMPEQGSFVLKGKALNIPDGTESFDLAVCHPFDNQMFSVTFDKKGEFCKELPIWGMQDIYLYLEDAVTVFSYPGDTLKLTFDFADCPASIRLSGTTEERTRELCLSLELYRKFRQEFLDLSQLGRERSRTIGYTPDSVMLKAIHHYATEYGNMVRQFVDSVGSIAHEEYLLQRGYFTAMDYAATSPAALRTLAFTSLRLTCGNRESMLPVYEDVAFNPFSSSAALDFMWTYLSVNVGRAVSIFKSDGKKAVSLFDGVREDSFAKTVAVADIMIPNRDLREWFLAISYKRGLDLFGWKPTEELKAVGTRLFETMSQPMCKEIVGMTLQRHFSLLVKGAPAPDFTLMDDKGKLVSLSSLKGKVVYLDIWGEGCGPCIYEFKQQDVFHKKYAAYKDRMVYLYICTRGTTEKRWKELIKRYKLKGINLMVPREGESPIAVYDRNAMPLYVLIDAEGKIVSYDAPRPSQLLRDEPNILDELLKK